MKRIFCVLCAVVTGLLAVLYVPVGAESAAAATVLIEAETGQLLLGENAHTVQPMGTFAKLMTALLTAEAVAAGRCTPETLVTAPNAVSGCKGAVIWLLPGEKMSVGDLLRGLLVGNATDAAITLAAYLSGAPDRFVMDMNARGFELGLRDTVFTDPSGAVADERQVTTAYDLALLCRATLAQPLLYEAMSTWRTFLRGEQTELVNENTLTRTYEGLLGCKAAHGDSGYSVAAAARRGDDCYIAVVLGADDEHARFSMAKQLLGRGFSGFQRTLPAFSDEFMRPLSVRHGTASAVALTVEGLHGLVLPKSDGESTSVVVLPDYIDAPVRAGQRIGSVAFYSGDTLVYEVPLVAAESVPRMTWRVGFMRLLDKMLK